LLRKERGLEVSDRIRLYVAGDAGLERLLVAHGAYIRAETLSVAVETDPPAGAVAKEVRLDGLMARVTLERVP
jgi:hypothetical protein